MSTVTTIGLDIAKSVFQVHGISATGEVLIRRQVRRGQMVKFFASLPSCLIGIEACASAHHWSRELQSLGHEVKLMPPAYVKPYVKRQKNDMADAEAICEAVARPTMRFVETKTCEQQSMLMLHRVRALLIRQRTMLVNALRGHLAEFGIIVAQGISRIRALIAILTDESADAVLPPLARRALAPLVDPRLDLQPRIRALEAELLAWHRQSQEPQARDDPGCRLHHRHSHRGDCDRSRAVPLRPGVYRLAGTDTASEFVWRQGAVGADLQDGGWLLATAAGGRRHGGDPLCSHKDRGRQCLDRRAARQEASSAGVGGSGQQDGPDRLGAFGQWRGLPISGTRRRLSATAG
jgi:hypothetical protein